MNLTIQRSIRHIIEFVISHWLYSVVILVVAGVAWMFSLSKMPMRQRLYFVWAELLPPMLWTIYLALVKYLPSVLTPIIKGLALPIALVAVIAGLIFLVRLPIRPVVRALLSAIYIPAMTSFLIGYGLLVACYVFHDCL
jgi:hypothetical protein